MAPVQQAADVVRRRRQMASAEAVPGSATEEQLIPPGDALWSGQQLHSCNLIVVPNICSFSAQLCFTSSSGQVMQWSGHLHCCGSVHGPNSTVRNIRPWMSLPIACLASLLLDARTPAYNAPSRGCVSYCCSLPSVSW